jgi:hypothetical protein
MAGFRSCAYLDALSNILERELAKPHVVADASGAGAELPPVLSENSIRLGFAL